MLPVAKKSSTSRSSAGAKKKAALDASARIVVLRGPDQYLKLAHTKKLIEALETEHGEIEQFSFDGSTAEPAVILDELRSFGLMQQMKLVIVDQADKLLAAKDDGGSTGGARTKTSRELFERYAAQPVDSAVLLLRAETWRPGKIDKLIEKVGVIIKCEAPGEAQAIAFCMERCARAYECDIERPAAGMLVQRIGAELARLDVELAKLAAYVGGERAITPDDVRAMVGLSREEQAWSIQSVLVRGDAAAGVRALRELLEVSSQPKELLGWAISDLARKLYTASELASQGAGDRQIMKQAKLWGEAGSATLGAARRLGPARSAHLLRMALEADRMGKTGYGDAERTLETLVVRFADTMQNQ